ncbi:MAG: PLP-dependent aminotransferase family protein [Clostridiaceae bacterium]|nr:PLP-dependent aminotransferase family protein [Clostridiaceae bacterium]
MQFSKKVQPLFESGRESGISKLSDPTLIKLSIGNPPNEGFPVDRIRQISKRLLEEDPYSMLSYSIAGGRGDLKAAIKSFLNRRFAVVNDNDEITVTGGGQQAISLAAQLFCNDGDTILCENPTFMAALDTLKSQGAKLLGVKMDDDGINIEDLEKKMQSEPKPKLLYVIADFQNPTGISLPEHKRRAICELAYKYDIPVLEDNPYYELRYDGEFIPFIKCFDTHGMVALTSSMSKIVAPGMRVGYVIASGKIGLGFALLKSSADLHVSTWAQRICCTLLEEGMDEEIMDLRALYGHRGRLMLSCLEKDCNPSVKFTHPQGGMFIWVTLPEGSDMPAFVEELSDNKVVVVPGNQFCPDGGKDSTSFRLCYALACDDEIEKAIGIIGRLTYKYCK